MLTLPYVLFLFAYFNTNILKSTLFVFLILDGLLQPICFRMFCSKRSKWFLLKTRTYLLSFWFHCVDIFYIEFRFCETFTVINSVIKILLIKTLYKFRAIKCWFTLYLHVYVLGYYKFKCFVYPASLSCVSHAIDICTVAIKNIRNMQAVSTNQITYILHFNDNNYILVNYE